MAISDCSAPFISIFSFAPLPGGVRVIQSIYSSSVLAFSNCHSLSDISASRFSICLTTGDRREMFAVHHATASTLHGAPRQLFH
jgi:hypothetical protein